MPYCPNCGTEVSEGTQFCRKCGRGLTTKQGAKRMSWKKKVGIIMASIIGIPTIIIIIVATIQVIITPTYTLSVDVNPPGIVSPTSEKHKSGTNVTLTATPPSGYTFDHWEGDASGTSPTITITMNSDKTITACFKRQTYILTMSTSPSGTGSLSPSSGVYESGAEVTVTASPASGYVFDHWSGDASGTVSSIRITMDSDKNVIANFRAATKTYTLTVNISPSGAGSVSPSGGNYESGTQVTLTASPASGYSFDYWSGSASGATSTITVTMNSNKSVTANFKTAPSDKPIKITATQLYAEYDENPVRADQKYKGQLLQVSGVVDSIGHDYVSLNAGAFLATIHCSFAAEQQPQIAQVDKGQLVTIQGRCTGYLSVLSVVYLESCRLV